MKVLDLQCSHQHSFEGWFGSEADFQDQLGRGQVECPLCGDVDISKMLSAPRLNLGAAREPSARPQLQQHEQPQHEVVAAPNKMMQAAWMKMVRHVMANTEDVGAGFAEEARRIHYGESEGRGIRGQASADETQALLEEGIDVLPLPIPKALKEPLQ